MPKFKAFKYFIIKWATLSNTFNGEESFEPLAVQIWVAYCVQVTLLTPSSNLTLIDIINVACPPSTACLSFSFLSTLILKHLLCGNKNQQFLELSLTQTAPTASGTNGQELSDRLSVTAHRMGTDPQIFQEVSGSRIRVSGSILLPLGRLWRRNCCSCFTQ